ncbi:replication initiation protein [Campylobacter sp. CCUG 57310]|uniref:replication initiation protein n=1 Tax=Campylobacter sp. CCUG 57310 TaxID=2517362 RepID=UPI001562FB30|nr:replication initiation protein [Campylobacter sp. CCUG 57310]QKF93236.1 replication initiation protein (rep_3 family) [Campylobacter sp. CCUG 57310]
MTKEITKNLSNRSVVVQSNSMINSKYELTETQQKLILLAIAQIKTADEKFFRYSCTVSELEQKLGVKLNETRLKDLAKDILKKPLEIKEQNKWIGCNWFSAFIYHIDQGRFEFEISPTLTPYLLQLKKEFTTYNIEQAIKFSGKYTTRFYQFMIQAQHQRDKKRVFVLEELYELLQLPKTLRNFAKFRQYVIEPSIEEINKKSDIQVDYEVTKKIRKKAIEITLRFDFKERLVAQTAQAIEAKELNKYKGKEFSYFGALFKIEYLQINEEKNRIEAIFIDPRDDQKARADFDSLEHLDRAIREAKELKAEMKSNPEKYKKKDRDVSGLF